MGIGQFFKKCGSKIDAHSDEILIGLGLSGFYGSTVSAVKATPAAIDAIEARKKELGVKELSKGEIIKICWKFYIPPIALSAVSTACVIGSNRINHRKSAALATAYAVTKTQFDEYAEKVREELGKGGPLKEKRIKDKIAAESISKADPKQTEVRGNGDFLCMDSLTGQFFYSDVTRIEKAVNVINSELNDTMFADLNGFLDMIGCTMTKLGNDLGWHQDQGLLEVSFGSTVLDADTAARIGVKERTPCTVLYYSIQPRYDFDILDC